MKKISQLFSTTCVLVMLSACATSPLSEQLSGRKLPVAVAATGNDLAEISFSSEKKFETPGGVPLAGDPVVCVNGKVSRVNDGTSAPSRIAVRAGEEIAVTSVVAWENTGFRKVCGRFVLFTPEKGAKYVVVNERLGGKGISAMWTGMARQTCEVSVYKETSNGTARIQTRPANATQCGASEG
jgi:hypothetical protein